MNQCPRVVFVPPGNFYTFSQETRVKEFFNRKRIFQALTLIHREGGVETTISRSFETLKTGFDIPPDLTRLSEFEFMVEFRLAFRNDKVNVPFYRVGNELHFRYCNSRGEPVENN